jgi:hypothetical protein
MRNGNLKILENANDEWFLLGLKDNFIVCIDGGHSDISGVSKALKLHKAIFGERRYEGVVWKAALLRDVPAIDVPINDEAATICRDMVEQYRRSRGDV